MDVETIKDKIIESDPGRKIKFIVLFGSHAKGKNTPLSDIDIAVYYDGNPEERFRFRIKVLGNFPDKVDVQIFQDLPLALRKEVLSGKVLFSKDYSYTFNVFHNTIKEYNAFERHLKNYYHELEKRVGLA